MKFYIIYSPLHPKDVKILGVENNPESAADKLADILEESIAESGPVHLWNHNDMFQSAEALNERDRKNVRSIVLRNVLKDAIACRNENFGPNTFVAYIGQRLEVAHRLFESAVTDAWDVVALPDEFREEDAIAAFWISHFLNIVEGQIYDLDEAFERVVMLERKTEKSMNDAIRSKSADAVSDTLNDIIAKWCPNRPAASKTADMIRTWAKARFSA